MSLPCVDRLIRALGSGTVPTDSEEGRRFYQARLAFFAKVYFLVGGSFAILMRVLLLVTAGQWHPGPRHAPDMAISIVFIAVTFAVWRLCVRRQFSVRMLSVLDLGLAVLVAGGPAVAGLVRPERLIVDGYGLLLATSMVMFRALLLPCAATWTLSVSAAAVAPVVGIAAFRLYGELDPDALGVASPLFESGIVVLWGLAAIVLATIASSVIYGLQRMVHEARQLGQYVLEEKLGEGAMGMVYRAHHAMLRRPTAVKLLRPERAGEECIARFEREVTLTSLLTHPNTIAIYDYGRTPDGIFYYAMELLPGVTLQSLVEKSGPQTEARVIHILRQTAGSLAEAHGRGLIHRDIKPSNIMLCERGGVCDVVKVLDFGLVKDITRAKDAGGTTANMIAGTPHYLSPEAIRTPYGVDNRSDIYALGAVGYFLLCGKTLFEGANVIDICSQQLTARPQPPSQRCGRAIAPDLEAVIMRCLEKSPADRPHTSERFIEALDSCAAAREWSAASARAWWSEHGCAELAFSVPPPAVSPATRTATIRLEEGNRSLPDSVAHDPSAHNQTPLN